MGRRYLYKLPINLPLEKLNEGIVRWILWVMETYI